MTNASGRFQTRDTRKITSKSVCFRLNIRHSARCAALGSYRPIADIKLIRIYVNSIFSERLSRYIQVGRNQLFSGLVSDNLPMALRTNISGGAQ